MLHGLSFIWTALAVWMPASQPAGTVVRLSPAELIERCDLCLEGRVTAARAILEPGKRIDTEYTIAVERTLWGEPQASRAIRLPGGVLTDGRGMLIPGLPGLAAGDEVILFLSRPDAVGMRMPIGLAQGRMRIATDLHGAKYIARDDGELVFASPGAGASAGAGRRTGPSGARPADETSPIEYATVIAEIEKAAAARRARSRSGDPKAPKATGGR